VFVPMYVYTYIYIYTHTHTHTYIYRRTPVPADLVSTVSVICGLLWPEKNL
jgi:hypothetical protein